MTDTNEEDEILDLVTEQDEAIGSVRRRYIGGGKEALGPNYVRAASCFIVNTKGELWVPRRGPHKKIAPNGLDYSAGGHVGAGETYEQAMIREIAEELNMAVAPTDLVAIGKEMPDVTPPHYYFQELYIIRSDDTPAYNTDDFVSAEWTSVDVLKQLLKNGEPAKSSLAIALDFVSAYMAQHKDDK